MQREESVYKKLRLPWFLIFWGERLKAPNKRCYFGVRLMTDTFYLHLEFGDKNCGWSINLPFLCSKCGVCCTLDDFLTAGEINAKPQEHSEVHTKMKALSEMLGKMWKADQTEYDEYIVHTSCPFLVNNACSIYEIRPDGCRLFPKTVFGMLTQDCEALNRFKRMRIALKKGKANTETYHFTRSLGSAECDETIKPSKFTEKQFQTCITKLRRAGMTYNEWALFNQFNGIVSCNKR
jgi:Fe-S-cluster containining protein